jgi:hypothetical protein
MGSGYSGLVSIDQGFGLWIGRIFGRSWEFYLSSRRVAM